MKTQNLMILVSAVIAVQDQTHQALALLLHHQAARVVLRATHLYHQVKLGDEEKRKEERRSY